MPNKSWIQEKGEAIIIEVLISPKASKNKIVGLHDNRLKIRIAAPPVDGKANIELVKFLADELGTPTYNIEIETGYSSKRKTIKISGITKDVVEGLIV